MAKETTFEIILTLLLVSMLTSAFNIPLLMAEPIEPPTIEWSKTYGGAGGDIALSLQQTDDNCYIVAGGTDSFGSGLVDFWLVKVDAVGNLQWNKTYGGDGGDEALSVWQTSDEGYIVAGESYSFGAGHYDFLLVKTDKNGNMEWNKTYGGSEYDGAWSVRQTSDGGYIAAGYTSSFGKGAYDFWLVKTDDSGTVQWNRTYGGDSSDWASSVGQTQDGGYIVAGYTSSFGLGGVHFWLIKTDADGNVIWDRIYGVGGEVAYSVQQTSDKGFIVAGVTSSLGAGGNDFWLVKTDSSGTMLWNRTYGGANNEVAKSVEQTSDGGYIAAGYTNSFGAGAYDFWVVKTDANGNTEWNQTYGKSGIDMACSIKQSRDLGYIVAGSIDSGQGNYDLWLIKLAPSPFNPEEALEKLIHIVESLNLKGGIETSLASKLWAAHRSLGMKNMNAAIGQLKAFINQAEALKTKELTNEQASFLIAEAQKIIDLTQGQTP